MVVQKLDKSLELRAMVQVIAPVHRTLDVGQVVRVEYCSF